MNEFEQPPAEAQPQPVEQPPAEAQPAAPPPKKPRPEPVVGQRYAIEVLKDVWRPGTPRRKYETGDVVTWDDHMVFLHQEGAVLPARME